MAGQRTRQRDWERQRKTDGERELERHPGPEDFDEGKDQWEGVRQKNKKLLSKKRISEFECWRWSRKEYSLCTAMVCLLFEWQEH